MGTPGRWGASNLQRGRVAPPRLFAALLRAPRIAARTKVTAREAPDQNDTQLVYPWALLATQRYATFATLRSQGTRHQRGEPGRSRVFVIPDGARTTRCAFPGRRPSRPLASLYLMTGWETPGAWISREGGRVPERFRASHLLRDVPGRHNFTPTSLASRAPYSRVSPGFASVPDGASGGTQHEQPPPRA